MLKKIMILFCVCATLFINSLAYADRDFVNRPDVRVFIHEMARKHHFDEQTLIALFDAVKIRPKVIQSVKYPLEQKPWYSYQVLFVTDWRIRQGVKFWNQHRDALERAEKIYGVPASIIVATIGVETKYGAQKG